MGRGKIRRRTYIINHSMKLGLIGCLLLLTFFLNALELPDEARPIDEDGDGKPERWELAKGNNTVRVFVDTDGDGRINYIQEYDENGYKLYEALDFNGDGEIDDHYYYRGDVLQHREIDSNYDGNIDIWVYLREGVYIESYRRDSDYDGKVDLEKNFDGGKSREGGTAP